MIEGRDGTKFLFHRVGESARPRRAQEPLPKTLTDKWDLDSSGLGPEDWQMNG